MIDYIYEVRFPNNPDPTFTQKFSDRKEAEACHADNEGSELYMLELDYDDYTGIRGIGHLVSEIKLEDDLQPEEAPVETKPEFRAPVLDDDLDDEPIAADSLNGLVDSDDDEDDMTDEELGEALFSALNNNELEEDAAGTIDDPVEGEEVCAWCGEAIPVSSLKFEKDLGFICDRCQAAIASHEGDDSLEF